LLAGDRVRQSGRQTRQDEPVRREPGECGEVEQETGRARRRARRDAQDQPGAHQIRPNEHLPAPPAVEEDPREGPDDGERQQQDGEGLGHLGRGGRVLRREHHIGGQRGLEGAVPELADQTHRQQQPEPAQAGTEDHGA